MTWKNVIVIDQGTHSTRAIIYNYAGESIFTSQQEVDLNYLNSLFIEQDAQQILTSCQKVLDDANQYISNNTLENIAIALTTQRSTVLAWDGNTGKAITSAVSWLDTRAQEELKNVSLSEQSIKEKTGLPLSAHYGASKLQWLLHNDVCVQECNNQIKYGPLAAYLIYNLLEQQPCTIDYSNAHRTLLWNLQTKEWDNELLNAFDINSSCLPTPVPNSYNYGKLKKYTYPLVYVSGDQNSATYGYGKLTGKTTLINIGTGAFVLANSENKPILNTNLIASITYSSEVKQEYALEGTVNGAGAALSWAEEVWGINNIESIEWKGIKEVPVFLNTIGGLGSPFWRSDVKARFLDDTKTNNNYTNQQCMAALMESIIFLLTINIEEIQKSGIEINQLLISGGMSKDQYMCQCLANLNNIPVIVSNFKEATSRGAAWWVFEQPGWDILKSEKYSPDFDTKLLGRYHQFTNAIKKLVYINEHEE